jgi:hypothetical protein
MWFGVLAALGFWVALPFLTMVVVLAMVLFGAGQGAIGLGLMHVLHFGAPALAAVELLIMVWLARDEPLRAAIGAVSFLVVAGLSMMVFLQAMGLY